MKFDKRKRIWLLLVVSFGAAGLYLYFDLRDFLGFTTMSPNTAEKAWGVKEFSPECFRNGSKAERAFQVVNLIRSKQYIGKDLATVRTELGEHDAYYNSDEIPAYSLPEFNGSSWDLVFLPERGRIFKVIIHKECCYHGILNLFLR